MKTRFLPLFLVGLAAAEPVKFDTLKTTDGREYAAVTVTEKRPDGISIRHSGGTARIGFEFLTGLQKSKLGGFNTEEAKKAREADERELAAMEAALEKQIAAISKDPALAGEGEEMAKDDRRVAVPNANKLFVKPTLYNGAKRLEITGRAGDKPVTVVWGSGSMTIPPWTTQVARPVWKGENYTVSAYEDGGLVDKETSRQKTGLGTDYKLR